MTINRKAKLGYNRNGIKTEIGKAFESIKGISDLQELIEIDCGWGNTALQGSPIAYVFGHGFQFHARGNEEDPGADFGNLLIKNQCQGILGLLFSQVFT